MKKIDKIRILCLILLMDKEFFPTLKMFFYKNLLKKGKKATKKATKKLQIVAFIFLLCSFYRSPKKRQNCDKSDNL